MCINRAVCSASALHLRYAQAHRALCSASALRLRYTQAQRAAFACFEMTINGHVTSDYSRAERQQPQCALLHCGLAHGSVRGPRLADFMAHGSVRTGTDLKRVTDSAGEQVEMGGGESAAVTCAHRYGLEASHR